MQAEKHYHERIWGLYPQLDQLLSRNQLSMHWYGPTSLSRNIFNQVEDLLTVYALVADQNEYADQNENIRSLCRKPGSKSLRRDLETLAGQLDWMSKYFRDASRLVQKNIMY